MTDPSTWWTTARDLVEGSDVVDDDGDVMDGCDVVDDDLEVVDNDLEVCGRRR